MTTVNNLINTFPIVLGGNLTFSGAYNFTGTLTNTTTVTFPTSGTLATTSQLPSLPLSLANGGTNANNTASNGGIVYSSATAFNVLAGTATANQVLLSGSSTTPAWSTATYPATTTVNQILYSSSANVIAGLTTGNNGVLITSGGGVPSISSTLPAAVQGNITAVGTVTSGVWNGTAIDLAHGGTNANLTASNGGIFYSTASAGAILAGTATASLPLLSGSSTTPTWGSFALSLGGALTTAGALTTSGAFGATFTFTNTTSVTFPTSGTLATTSQLPTLPLSLANGGTNANLTASNGGIFYSTASAGAILSGTATAGQLLLSGSSTAPTWSTSTYPATNAANTLLYASSANTMAALATVDSAVLVTNASGVPAWSSTMTNGQVIIGDTSGTPAAATLTAGTNISITNGANSITIAAIGEAGITYSTVTTNTAVVVNTCYYSNSASQLQFTLPALAAVGSIVQVRAQGTGGFSLIANTLQTIQFGNVASTTGGSFSTSTQYDTISVECMVANTTWIVTSALSQGFTKA